MLEKISALEINQIISQLNLDTSVPTFGYVSKGQPITVGWFNEFSRQVALKFNVSSKCLHINANDEAIIPPIEELFTGEEQGVLIQAWTTINTVESRNKIKLYKTKDIKTTEDLNEYIVVVSPINTSPINSSKLVKKVIEIANDIQGKDNAQSYVRQQFLIYGGWDIGNAAWCCATTTVIWALAGMAPYVGMSASCGSLIGMSTRFHGIHSKYLKWISNTEGDGYETGSTNRLGVEPEVGDAVIYDWAGDGEPNSHNHIGIIIEKNGSQILVKEGNPNHIRDTTIYSSSIMGYLRPDYIEISKAMGGLN